MATDWAECLWGGPQAGACWDVGACGCAVIPRPESSVTNPRLSLWDRVLLAVMQAPVRIGRRR